MKKLLTLALMITMTLPASGLACDETDAPLIPICENASLTYSDCSWWAISENRLLFGKLREDEAVPCLPIPSPTGCGIRGFLENGMVREHASMNFLKVEGRIYGLQKLNVTITIFEKELAESIIHRRLGDDAILSANSIASCTLWIQGDSIYHIFFPSTTTKVAIATATFNGGRNTVYIYAGDHNGDGLLEMGFSAGWQQMPSKQPEPEKKPEKPEREPVTEPSTEEPCKPDPQCQKKPCVTTTINIQVGLVNIMNSCVRFIQGCMEALKK